MIAAVNHDIPAEGAGLILLLQPSTTGRDGRMIEFI